MLQRDYIDHVVYLNILAERGEKFSFKYKGRNDKHVTCYKHYHSNTFCTLLQKMLPYSSIARNKHYKRTLLPTLPLVFVLFTNI